MSEGTAKPTKKSPRKTAAERAIPNLSGAKRKRPDKVGTNTGVVTPAWLKAGTENLAKGREKKKAMAEEGKKSGRDDVGVRWAKMLDGSMTVKDLSIEELNRMQLVGKDGTFSGRGRAIPSHIAQAMRNETIRRAQGALLASVHDAAMALGKIINDPEASSADITRASNIVMDRVLGKPTETVVITNESEWDKGVRESINLDREKDTLMDEEAGNA